MTSGTSGEGVTVYEVRENLFFEKMMNVIYSEIKDSQSMRSSVILDHRLTSRNKTLTFWGNHVGMRLNRAFEQSAETASYMQQDNVESLCNCLKGEARKSIEGLLLACASMEEILRSLDL